MKYKIGKKQKIDKLEKFGDNIEFLISQNWQSKEIIEQQGAKIQHYREQNLGSEINVECLRKHRNLVIRSKEISNQFCT